VDGSDVIETAFAMPLTSPSFPRGPYRHANREHLIVTYHTDRTALELAVPEPLEIGEPLVRCEFLRIESSTGFGRYSGAARHIPVRLNTESGSYTHDMFLDIHAPISGGRELWGFQQKLAAPRRHRDPRRYPLGSRNGPLLFKFAIVVLLAVFAVIGIQSFRRRSPAQGVNIADRMTGDQKCACVHDSMPAMGPSV
jgi:hypothetical protein